MWPSRLSTVLVLLSLAAGRRGAGEDPAPPLEIDPERLASIEDFHLSFLPGDAPPEAKEPPAEPGEQPASGGRAGPAIDLFADARFLFVSGYVDAREFTFPGNRFSFKDLNTDFGEKVGGGMRWNIDPPDTIELHGSYFFLRGSTTFPTDTEFNQTSMEGGHPIDSVPDWTELRLTYLRRLVRFLSSSSLWASVGVDYHAINWVFSATIPPTSPRKETREDFYLQTFPLPVFGLRYLLEIDPRWSIDVRADGFRANHWRHWANEGGPIYTSSTIIDAGGVVRWQPMERLFLQAGYVFEYYTLDEDGPEDGNHLLARQHGPMIAVGLSF
jgi:hypothetical protein